MYKIDLFLFFSGTSNELGGWFPKLCQWQGAVGLCCLNVCSFGDGARYSLIEISPRSRVKFFNCSLLVGAFFYEKFICFKM
jgi:hypothetical protein